MKRFLLIWCSLSLLCACDNKSQSELPFFDSEDVDMAGFEFGSNTVSIPFRESGGVKIIEVTINGLSCDMIFDTGCSTTLISIAEANYLYQKGLLDDEDILGISEAVIADGSIVENMVVNLKQVVIGGQIVCDDVRAVVSSNARAPLLLGNEILDRVSSFSVDNENHVINFKMD